MEEKKYQIIYADPAWQYKSKECPAKKSILIWVVYPMLDECIDVLKSWGFKYSILSESKTKHSSKPEEIRNRITQMFPTQNKIELFARQKTEGWDVWGNEIESDITL